MGLGDKKKEEWINWWIHGMCDKYSNEITQMVECSVLWYVGTLIT